MDDQKHHADKQEQPENEIERLGRARDEKKHAYTQAMASCTNTEVARTKEELDEAENALSTAIKAGMASLGTTTEEKKQGQGQLKRTAKIFRNLKIQEPGSGGKRRKSKKAKKARKSKKSKKDKKIPRKPKNPKKDEKIPENTKKDKQILKIPRKQKILRNQEINKKLETEKVDVTLPERPFKNGKIHPVSQVIDEISSIFSEIGFSVEEGPDVENEYNNFTALNTPDNHPARDMHDTFYLDHKKNYF